MLNSSNPAIRHFLKMVEKARDLMLVAANAGIDKDVQKVLKDVSAELVDNEIKGIARQRILRKHAARLVGNWLRRGLPVLSLLFYITDLQTKGFQRATIDIVAIDSEFLGAIMDYVIEMAQVEFDKWLEDMRRGHGNKRLEACPGLEGGVPGWGPPEAPDEPTE